MPIIIKTAEDIEKMRIACRLAAEVLDYITPFVKPGVTTEEIDRLCHDYMVNVQGVSATKAGLSVEQFLLFVESTTAATHEVVSECERLGFLNLPEIQVGSESVH